MFSHDLIASAPHAPGVYLMLDSKSTVLYVGKAKDLSKRLASYTRQDARSVSKTSVMLAQVNRVDTIMTNTEKEALILEASLIKKHSPKYNIILRDDKNYPYIKVTTQEEWPRVMMVRRKQRDSARYFGPYASSSAMWATLKLIARLFPLRRCKGHDIRPRKRPCLNYQMGQCMAPCAGNANREAYFDNVKKIIMILEGKNKALISELETDMQACAESLDFEQAARLRDQKEALSRTLEKQVVASDHVLDQDVIGFHRKDASVGVAILFIRGGLISGSRSYFLADPFGDDTAILSQILNQFYFHGPNIPQEIVIPFPIDDIELLEERFCELREAKTHIIIPKRGTRTTLVQMAETNAQQLFEEREKKKESWQTLSQSLVKKLHLRREPQIIECLDISNIGGKQAVGSLVCFVKGEAEKNRFRHYRIKTIEGPNDYAMMAEVLTRRFTKGIERDDLPALFMVDGGKGQLNIALAIAGELGITDDIEWVGIAKERQEEGEKLYRPGRKNPILLKPHDPVLLHLMRIRDESHRFGITFHRHLRQKESFTSELDAIQGVGQHRKKQLLQTMGSLKRVKEASLDELLAVPGIGNDLARTIYTALHPDSGENSPSA